MRLQGRSQFADRAKDRVFGRAGLDIHGFRDFRDGQVLVVAHGEGNAFRGAQKRHLIFDDTDGLLLNHALLLSGTGVRGLLEKILDILAGSRFVAASRAQQIDGAIGGNSV